MFNVVNNRKTNKITVQRTISGDGFYPCFTVIHLRHTTAGLIEFRKKQAVFRKSLAF